MKSFKEYLKETEEGASVEESGKNRHHFIRHNIWTVMDSDEEVLQHSVEGDPFFSAKKFIRDLDDQGYEFTHVVSPEGKITYLPQHDPRHLKNFPDDQGVAEGSHEDQVSRLAAYNEKMAGENPPIDLGLREVGNWAKVGHYGNPIKTAWFNIAKYGIRNNKFNDSVDKAMSAIGDFPDKYDLSIPEIDTLYSAYETVYDQWEQSKSQQGVAEGAGPGIMVNGKEVDMSSLEVDGVDSRDYPDFADAYFSAGYFVDGTEMSDEELDQFQQDNGDLLYDKAYDSLHESELSLIKDRAGVNKSDVPAHQRKNSGDPDWKVSHDDLKKERERNTSGSEGLAALKKRMGMIEDGTE